jgi:hypothetical protein
VRKAVQHLITDVTRYFDFIYVSLCVSIAVRYFSTPNLVRSTVAVSMIGRSGFDSRRWLGILLFDTASRQAMEPTQPPIQRVPGVLSLGVKRPGRETDHSPTSSAEVKNAWSYTSTPQYAFMAWCSVKAQGQLYLYLTYVNQLVVAFHYMTCISIKSEKSLDQLSYY